MIWNIVYNLVTSFASSTLLNTPSRRGNRSLFVRKIEATRSCLSFSGMLSSS